MKSCALLAGRRLSDAGRGRSAVLSCGRNGAWQLDALAPHGEAEYAALGAGYDQRHAPDAGNGTAFPAGVAGKLCGLCRRGGRRGGIRKRFLHTARQLRQEPLEGLFSAYAFACAQSAVVWEQEEEKTALETLFTQLGSGTAAMREQAAAACLRRLKPVCEKAQAEAEKGGRLCMQLGILLGLMAGIALW